MSVSHALLQVRDLRVDIGERTVLQAVSLDVQPGSLVVLMGANGSGKSTLGMALAGHPSYQVVSGQAVLDGKNLLELEAHERARAGNFAQARRLCRRPARSSSAHAVFHTADSGSIGGGWI